MNKTMKHMILIAAIALCGIVMTSCNGGNENNNEEVVQADTIANEKPPI